MIAEASIWYLLCTDQEHLPPSRAFGVGMPGRRKRAAGMVLESVVMDC